jgi:hypothetical protein
MNEQINPGTQADSRHLTTSAVQLAQAVATSMAEVAGNIGGTVAGAMAAPLTAASHAAAIAHEADGDGEAASPPHDDETSDATAQLEAGDGQGNESQADGAAGSGG